MTENRLEEFQIRLNGRLSQHGNAEVNKYINKQRFSLHFRFKPIIFVPPKAVPHETPLT